MLWSQATKAERRPRTELDRSSNTAGMLFASFPDPIPRRKHGLGERCWLKLLIIDTKKGTQLQQAGTTNHQTLLKLQEHFTKKKIIKIILAWLSEITCSHDVPKRCKKLPVYWCKLQWHFRRNDQVCLTEVRPIPPDTWQIYVVICVRKLWLRVPIGQCIWSPLWMLDAQVVWR